VPALAARPWTPPVTDALMAAVATETADRDPAGVMMDIQRLIADNHRIHDFECVNLNPATNVMNPKAEALLSSGLGTRPSLGYPGLKYEMGLEAIERIEIIAAELAAEVFSSRFAETRVGSGALANLSAFIATCRPGDTIIAPSLTIGGHITHHKPGCAGLYGLTSIPAPVQANEYTVDLDALRDLTKQVRPKLITIGGSLNLLPHPVSQVREIADNVGAKVLFDAAHLSGVIAGGTWPNPLTEGAHVMTMSTYKSLGGPPSGLVVTNDAELAERIDGIVYPGLTANFDVGKTAALAVTMLDWKVAGAAYAQRMVDTAQALAHELMGRGVPVFETHRGATASHQFAVIAHPYGGGQTAARRLRQANLLACGIGLPIGPVVDDLNGLRIGTPELARLGMTVTEMPDLASFISRGLDPDEDLAGLANEVTQWRSQFRSVHFTADHPN
jgi:glycine hydroxymethyltransferase